MFNPFFVAWYLIMCKAFNPLSSTYKYISTFRGHVHVAAVFFFLAVPFAGIFLFDLWTCTTYDFFAS